MAGGIVRPARSSGYGLCSHSDFKDVTEIKELDFSRDYGANLKIRLASILKDVRIRTMIDELASLRGLGANESALIQLAVDEGSDASKAAGAKFREMATNRANYKHPGHLALFKVICGVGDVDQAPAVEALLNDSDRWITHYARIIHPRIVQGHKQQPACGY